MSRGINKVILIGNLGQDPEVKHTQGGMAVATFSLATTSVRKDRDGNQQEKTEWHRCKAFGKSAEIIGEHVRKGSRIYVEGSIRYDKFTGQDGTEKYITEIMVNEFQMLGGYDDRSAQQERRSPPPPPQRGNRPPPPPPRREPPRREAPPPQQSSFASDFKDDDIPF